MERFLSACAGYINRKYGNNLADLCLVFPNHRSGSFFLSYLQKRVEKPVLAPEIITINDLMIHISGLNLSDRFYQVSQLYRSFIKISGSSESLDDFYFWGEMLLSDFNDTDKYLINTADLFKNLAGLKELDTAFDYLTESQKDVIRQFWDTLGHWEQFSHETSFINVWEILYPLYSDFRERLREEGMASEGMAYREAAERTNQNRMIGNEGIRYLFIGLNALNECEKTILHHLLESGKAEFLWDFDTYYVNDKTNGAGRFVSRNLAEFPPPPDFILKNSNFEEKKNIRIVAVSSQHGQSQIIPYAIASFGEDFNPGHDNTAIVLADETLLFSALGAIPDSVKSVNVTMGYSVKNSIVYGFVNLLTALLRNSTLSESGEYLFYYRNVFDILTHQLISGSSGNEVSEFIGQAKAFNRLTIKSGELGFSPIHQLIFKVPAHTLAYSDYFLEIFHSLFQLIKTKQPENLILPELIYTTCLAIEKLKDVLNNLHSKSSLDISPKIFFRLMAQYLGMVNIPFEGEPLSGLQVMGILETRCLDFDNLIILGLNEGQWPKSATGGSYIPYNLRKGFGLPGSDDQEAVSAYYFYRLIQRAKNVFITYNTSREGAGAGELSRYGEQLRYLTGHQPVMAASAVKFSGKTAGPVSIPGSGEIKKGLLDSVSSGSPLSPSRINTFLLCRLKFYLRYVAGLPEPDEITDEIDARMFGTIFHEVIENLYKPFTGAVLTHEMLSSLKNNKPLINKEILCSINKHYFKNRNDLTDVSQLTGKAYLVAENLKIFITRVFEIDEGLVPFTLRALEQKVNAMLSVPGISKPVYIGGIIDRMDEKDGITRIIDYKTGKVDKMDFDGVEKLFDPEEPEKYKEILQALIYTWIQSEQISSADSIRPGIYSLRSFFGDRYNPLIKFDKSEFNFNDLKESFLSHLKLTISAMFDPSIAYEQTKNIEACKYCAYNIICSRR